MPQTHVPRPSRRVPQALQPLTLPHPIPCYEPHPCIPHHGARHVRPGSLRRIGWTIQPPSWRSVLLGAQYDRSVSPWQLACRSTRAPRLAVGTHNRDRRDDRSPGAL
jgi:hypothetical protein